MTKWIPPEKRGKRLHEYENDIVAQGYGENAKPTMFKDTSIDSLIAKNCRERKVSLFSIVNILRV